MSAAGSNPAPSAEGTRCAVPSAEGAWPGQAAAEGTRCAVPSAEGAWPGQAAAQGTRCAVPSAEGAWPGQAAAAEAAGASVTGRLKPFEADRLRSAALTYAEVG